MADPLTVRGLVDRAFQHFNARVLADAARAWAAHIDAGGKLFLAMGGAMSTAGIGELLAPAIRAGLVHGISCTGANLEEDAFRLVGYPDYRPIAGWSRLSDEEEAELYASGQNRVTDTTIPDSVMALVEEVLLSRWAAAAASQRQASPAEFLIDSLADPALAQRFHRPESSWLLAARDTGVPIWTPGWEDSTSGNAFSAAVIRGDLPGHDCVEPGTAQMNRLVRWYLEHCEPAPGIGFFQIGGGIAGDFPICVVPLIAKELQVPEVPAWGYFCQVGDAPASYGGYSGAPPNEKIAWGKLRPDTPRFAIQSDATIVVPLILAYLLEGC
ncbi:MAG: deoxyhypusine synthase family protein [Wenzhouxiangella sp.]